MGKKRKNEKTEEEIRRKIKKLQDQLNARISLEDNINCSPPLQPDVDHAGFSDLEVPVDEETRLFQPESPPASPRNVSPDPASPPAQPPPASPPPVAPPSPTPAAPKQSEEGEEGQDQDLDEEILQLLGDAPKAEAPMGPPIHKDVAARWQDILAKGLPKEAKEKLIKSYLVPANCDLLIAPALNLEVKAALQDTLVKRDSSLMFKQNQIGTALSALAIVTDMVIANETSKHKILKPLSDACRILCDSHFAETRTRRNFVINSINANLKDVLLDTERGNLLFGDNVTDKLKTAKTIQQSGEALKNAQKPNKINRPKTVSKGPVRGHLNSTPQHRKTDSKSSSASRAPRAALRASTSTASSSSRRHSPPPRTTRRR